MPKAKKIDLDEIAKETKEKLEKLTPEEKLINNLMSRIDFSYVHPNS